METVTIAINNETGRKLLHEMQEKHFVTVINTPNFDSLVFPGEPLTDDEFRSWVESREAGDGMSLKEAKAKWAKKEKQLLALAK